MENKVQAKRVNVVSLKVVKESSVLYKTRKISNPYDVYRLVKNFLIDSDREKSVVACLDTKNQPVSIEVVSVGIVNSAIVHPREVFKTIAIMNESKIICFHNYPSGNVAISKEDESITEKLIKSGEVLRIQLVDHIIVGDNDKYFSFKGNNKV